MRNAIDTFAMENTKETMVGNLIDREVYVNQSSLIEAVLVGQEGPQIDYDDIVNLRVDTEEEAKDLGYDSLEAMQDSGEGMKEVFEWWAVSEYLARQIKELGGVIIESGYGTWWGREETGQSLTMDGMLNSVAAKLMEVK